MLYVVDLRLNEKSQVMWDGGTKKPPCARWCNVGIHFALMAQYEKPLYTQSEERKKKSKLHFTKYCKLVTRKSPFNMAAQRANHVMRGGITHKPRSARFNKEDTVFCSRLWWWGSINHVFEELDKSFFWILHIFITDVEGWRIIWPHELLLLYCIFNYLFSCHRTASDANCWMISALLIAKTPSCLEEFASA